jgi:hypothetical protein
MTDEAVSDRRPHGDSLLTVTFRPKSFTVSLPAFPNMRSKAAAFDLIEQPRPAAGPATGNGKTWSNNTHGDQQNADRSKPQSADHAEDRQAVPHHAAAVRQCNSQRRPSRTESQLRQVHRRHWELQRLLQHSIWQETVMDCIGDEGEPPDFICSQGLEKIEDWYSARELRRELDAALSRDLTF